MSTWFSHLTYNNPIHGLDISPYVEQSYSETGDSFYLTDNCSEEYTNPTNAAIINFLSLNYNNCIIDEDINKEMFFDFYNGGLSYLFNYVDIDITDFYENNRFGIRTNNKVSKKLIEDILFNNFTKYKDVLKGEISTNTDIKEFLNKLVMIV